MLFRSERHCAKLSSTWPSGRADKAPNLSMFISKATWEQDEPESEEESGEEDSCDSLLPATIDGGCWVVTETESGLACLQDRLHERDGQCLLPIQGAAHSRRRSQCERSLTFADGDISTKALIDVPSHFTRASMKIRIEPHLLAIQNRVTFHWLGINPTPHNWRQPCIGLNCGQIDIPEHCIVCL